MNWMNGIAALIIIGIVSFVALPLLGLVQGLTEMMVAFVGLLLLVIAVFEVPGVVGRGHRKAEGKYGLDKVRKV